MTFEAKSLLDISAATIINSVKNIQDCNRLKTYCPASLIEYCLQNFGRLYENDANCMLRKYHARMYRGNVWKYILKFVTGDRRIRDALVNRESQRFLWNVGDRISRYEGYRMSIKYKTFHCYDGQSSKPKKIVSWCSDCFVKFFKHDQNLDKSRSCEKQYHFVMDVSYFPYIFEIMQDKMWCQHCKTALLLRDVTIWKRNEICDCTEDDHEMDECCVVCWYKDGIPPRHREKKYFFRRSFFGSDVISAASVYFDN